MSTIAPPTWSSTEQTFLNELTLVEKNDDEPSMQIFYNVVKFLFEILLCSSERNLMLTQVKGRPNRDQLRVSTFRGWSREAEKRSN